MKQEAQLPQNNSASAARVCLGWLTESLSVLVNADKYFGFSRLFSIAAC